jgi:hypothetical protein
MRAAQQGRSSAHFESRSAASGLAEGKRRCSSRGAPHGRLSSMVAAKGELMACTSSAVGRPARPSAACFGDHRSTQQAGQQHRVIAAHVCQKRRPVGVLYL